MRKILKAIIGTLFLLVFLITMQWFSEQVDARMQEHRDCVNQYKAKGFTDHESRGMCT